MHRRNLTPTMIPSSHRGVSIHISQPRYGPPDQPKIYGKSPRDQGLPKSSFAKTRLAQLIPRGQHLRVECRTLRIHDAERLRVNQVKSPGPKQLPFEIYVQDPDKSTKAVVG